MDKQIKWWRTSFGEEEIAQIAKAVRSENVSQGSVTEDFENKLSEFLEVEHVIAVASGSAALLLALLTLDVKPGDEVIIPNRTWIATAHAAHLLGAKVVLVDVEPDRPIIDFNQIEKCVTSKTKGIIPVHMNGRSANMREIRKIAQRHNLFVVEDAAQAMSSQNEDGYLGTQSDIGCYSLSVAKTIATGQGGFAVTKNAELASRMRAVRTHGVENVKDPTQWLIPGFNFRFTDVLASIGIVQLKRLPERIKYLREIYHLYLEGLRSTSFTSIPVDLNSGEVPVYNEFLVQDRAQWVEKLSINGVETRPFYPDINNASYLGAAHSNFPNSKKYGSHGIYLPSGPAQSLQDIHECIRRIKSIEL